MERYIEYFNGYRNAYGVADFNHQDSKIDSETGKKKPVYRWNFEELTKDIYQQHLEGKLSIGIQPCTEDSEVKFGVIDIDPKDYADFNKNKCSPPLLDSTGNKGSSYCCMMSM